MGGAGLGAAGGHLNSILLLKLWFWILSDTRTVNPRHVCKSRQQDVRELSPPCKHRQEAEEILSVRPESTQLRVLEGAASFSSVLNFKMFLL